MELDRIGLVRLWLHFAEVCYKWRVIVEGVLQTIKLGKSFFQYFICTWIKCTRSFEFHPGKFRQVLKHAVNKNRPMPGPSGRQISLLTVSGCTVSRSALQMQPRGNLGEAGIHSILFKPAISVFGNREHLFRETMFREMPYLFPSHTGTACLLDLRAEAIYIFDLLISQKAPQIRNTINHVCYCEGREV